MSLMRKTKRYLNKVCNRLDGKTFVITGANSGVGYKAAEELIYLGARVIMACRNEDKANAAILRLKEEYPDAETGFMKLDIADSRSIKAFASELREKQIDIDGFLNNAGVFRQPGKKTADGYELIMGTNYLGTYMLCQALIPYFENLDHEVKLVNTTSLSYKFSKVDFEDFFCGKNYRNFKVYGQSKLCITRYTVFLKERQKNSNIKIYMSHPGMTATPLALDSFKKRRLMSFGAKLLLQSNETCALSIPYIMSGRASEGSITGPWILFGGWGRPRENYIYKKAFCGGKELVEFTNRLLHTGMEQ